MNNHLRTRSSAMDRMEKRDAITRIRHAAERQGLDAGDLARMTGLAPGHARAILSGFGSTVPRETLDRTASVLPE
ncbi:helix-turn-helix domain-containing protein [Azospirillum isscasi]|uniref:Uncharacterized protein n=1 Tax=Azospirillum isscasi TaxID=3053926 RepID=A0ABU0WP46_9PROT|nr:hypothetical protein [Azospirillum isscasi]MDQ2106006.1 hypothetical protein [Azospirillum isscasi]